MLQNRYDISCSPMEQLGCFWTYVHEIFYLNIFRKSVEKISVSLKFDKNNGRFTWRRMYLYGISFSTWNEKWFRQKLQRKSKHVFSVQQFF
jgi:small-conductance mechanosensitive channel